MWIKLTNYHLPNFSLSVYYLEARVTEDVIDMMKSRFCPFKECSVSIFLFFSISGGLQKTFRSTTATRLNARHYRFNVWWFAKNFSVGNS